MKSKSSLPAKISNSKPLAIPGKGRRATSLGTAISNSQGNTVTLDARARSHHTHILGSTGTGKSKLLEHMIRQDMKNQNCGMCLVDPHGTLYEEVLMYASHRYPHLAKRIVTFNPAEDVDFLVGFNPISTSEENLDYSLERLVSACLKAWGQHNSDTSPRISRWLENIFMPIIAANMTMLETVPLTTPDHRDGKRAKLLSRVYNQNVLSDWAAFDSSSLTQKQNMMEGASNRLRKFLRNDTIRLILGQQSKKLDFFKIMEEGKILLVNLNGQDKIDRKNMQLIGTLMVNEIFSAAQLRDPRDQRLKPFYFYIDEFAQFVTRDIAYSLEEARKRKLFMILAHQHLAQLKKEDEYLYASVMTNCKNKIIFGGLSILDAKTMAEEVQTGFLNLKTVKHEQYRTRVRHHEETRVVRSTQRSQSHGENQTHSETQSETFGQNSSVAIGNSSADSNSRSFSTSLGTTDSFSNQHNQSTSRTHGSSQAQGWNSSSGSSQQRTDGYSSGSTKTRSETRTKGDSSSRSTGTGLSRGTSQTHGVNEGESIVPFLRPEEVQELAGVNFWSKDELMHMAEGALKNQGTAHAVVKIGSEPPIATKIDEVKGITYNKRLSPKMLKRFRERMIAAHPEYFTSVENARAECHNRQVKFFGEAIAYDSHFEARPQLAPSSDENDAYGG